MGEFVMEADEVMGEIFIQES